VGSSATTQGLSSEQDQHADRSSDGALDAIRQVLADQGLAALIVPTDDAHLSEYVADAFLRREFLSGFTGSAGTAVVSQDEALLWTDGRYFLQAERELSAAWKLMKGGLPDTPKVSAFLASNLNPGDRVAIDPFAHSANDAQELQTALAEKGIELVPAQENLVDSIWSQRPALPDAEARVHPLSFAGTSAEDKITQIRGDLKAKDACSMVVCALDEVAWLLNLRGADIAHNPVVTAYVVLTLDDVTLFVDEAKVMDDTVRAHLKEIGVRIRDYSQIVPAVATLAEEGAMIFMDPARTNYAIWSAVGGDARVSGASPVTARKARKNEAELEGMRNAHFRDGAAVCDFLAWLELRLDEDSPFDEVDVDEQITAFRAQREGYLENSFPTIAGFGENGAVIHYRAARPTAARVDRTKMLLIDSGAQYTDGTTDVTRTFHFGTPTQEEKESFTRVLQGNIGVDTAVFPENTPGFVLDVFARRSLWQSHRDYAHGTGHGVGAALNVHEGPQSISPRFGNTQKLEEGMVLSNEPGFYKAGHFGIRIENLLVVVAAGTSAPDSGNKKFFRFERLTHIPIEKRLIDVELMAPWELDWLDQYHRDVWHRLSPLVEDQTLEWLRQATSPLERK